MKTFHTVALFGCLPIFHLLTAVPVSTGGPLFEAIRSGDANRLDASLKDAAAVNTRDEFGNTPLMAAAWLADASVLERILTARADLNTPNHAGATALLYAATFDDKARLLVEHGADIKARSKLGNTALILAARKFGNSRTVKLLLERGADPNATNVFGSTPLMAAAAAGDSEAVLLLLGHGADINAKPNMDVDGFILGGGRTPLMWAAFLGNESLVKELLQQGARIGEFTQVGSALTQAAWNGQVGVARLLLEAGATADQRDLVANYTPLHWAASSESSSPALVDLLLAHGAVVNAEGGQPVDNFLGVTQTPLTLARKRGDTPVVTALLRAGARETTAAAQPRKLREPSTSGAESVAEAVQRGLPALVKTAEDSVTRFVRHSSKQKCISCHQQQLPLAAMSLAHSRHFTTDRIATRHQLALVTQEIADPEISLQGSFLPDPAIFAGYVAMDLQFESEPASIGTDAMVHILSTVQHPDGHWSRYIPRPPIQASDITATASAVHMIGAYPIPARRQELESCIQRARAWLTRASAETKEERVHQLLGLAWSGEKPEALKPFTEGLIRQQREDGGWAQLAGLESDAYATGQSLYALVEGGGIGPVNPAVRRGLDYLRRTQLADGTWYVRSRTHTFQPPMASAFPHGKDGWISASATSWAVIALARSLDPTETSALSSSQAKAAIPDSASSASTTFAASKTTPVDFKRDIQPVLERSCVTCHSGDHPKGGFRVTDRAAFLEGGKRGDPAVVPGNPGASSLLRMVHDQIEDLEMPPVAKRGDYPALTSDEIAQVRAWIGEGANWPEGVRLSRKAE